MPDLSQSEKFEIMFARMALLEQQLNAQQHQITEQQKTITGQQLLASEQQLELTEQKLLASEQQKTIAQLKEQASSNLLSVLETEAAPAPARSGLTTTRRKMLGKLAAAMVAGAAAASVLPGGEAQARVGIDLKADDLSRRIGAIVVPPGSPFPTGTPPGSSSEKYGLVATDGSDTAFGLASLPFGGTGVYGKGSFYGVYGNGNTGVSGQGTNTGVFGYGTNNGVYGTGPNGVYGNGTNNGVYGTGPNGVYGNGTNGVYGFGYSYGVYGYGYKGVVGEGSNTGVSGKGNTGVDAQGTTTGVYGYAPLTGNAGYFNGNVQVTGTIYKGAVSFKIDHPVDPANKYLYHTCIESPDMMNIYNGIATLDANGEATVTLPDWFETLNRDFRYGLTNIGSDAPIYISQEVQNNTFKIKGGPAGHKVSWQLTGIRQDKWANAHRIPVEETKPANEKGLYLHPTLYGQSEDKSVNP